LTHVLTCLLYLHRCHLFYIQLFIHSFFSVFFFFNDTAPTEIYTLSLHDALPISRLHIPAALGAARIETRPVMRVRSALGRVKQRDRKSTRLNSSHVAISYAVFCLKKKNPTGCHGRSTANVPLQARAPR